MMQEIKLQATIKMQQRGQTDYNESRARYKGTYGMKQPNRIWPKNKPTDCAGYIINTQTLLTQNARSQTKRKG